MEIHLTTTECHLPHNTCHITLLSSIPLLLFTACAIVLLEVCGLRHDVTTVKICICFVIIIHHKYTGANLLAVTVCVFYRWRSNLIRRHGIRFSCLDSTWWFSFRFKC